MASLQTVVYQLMDEAKRGTLDALHCAALLTKGNKIMLTAVNTDRSYIGGESFCSFHAEHRIINSFEHSKHKCILQG